MRGAYYAAGPECAASKQSLRFQCSTAAAAKFVALFLFASRQFSRVDREKGWVVVDVLAYTYMNWRIANDIRMNFLAKTKTQS